METDNDKGRAGDVWREQDREDQRFGHSDSQTKFNEASGTAGGQLGRTTGKGRTGAVSIVSGQSAEATDGGIVRQLIDNLQSQRAFHQQQIESIDEEIAGLVGLADNLETESSDDE